MIQNIITNDIIRELLSDADSQKTDGLMLNNVPHVFNYKLNGDRKKEVTTLMFEDREYEDFDTDMYFGITSLYHSIDLDAPPKILKAEVKKTLRTHCKTDTSKYFVIDKFNLRNLEYYIGRVRENYDKDGDCLTKITKDNDLSNNYFKEFYVDSNGVLQLGYVKLGRAEIHSRVAELTNVLVDELILDTTYASYFSDLTNSSFYVNKLTLKDELVYAADNISVLNINYYIHNLIRDKLVNIHFIDCLTAFDTVQVDFESGELINCKLSDNLKLKVELNNLDIAYNTKLNINKVFANDKYSSVTDEETGITEYIGKFVLNEDVEVILRTKS